MMNDIGHDMAKMTFTEFVESQVLLDALDELGIDYAQGLFVGPPIGES